MSTSNETQKTQASGSSLAVQPAASGESLNYTPLDPKLLTARTYEELEWYHQLAVDMRADLNYRYGIIAKRLTRVGYRVGDGAVRHWFAVGGPCYYVFNDIKEKRLEELKIEIENCKSQISEGVVDALAVLRTSLKMALESGDITESAYANAKDMLDRGGYPKQSKNDISGNLETPGMNEMASAIRGILEYKIPEPEQPKIP